MSDIAGFKLRFVERNHHPICAPKAPLLQGAVISDSVPPDTSIILGEKGKKNFEARYCAPQDYVPKKQIKPKISEEVVNRGKRCIAPPSTGKLELSHNERVHYPEEFGKAGDELGFGRRKSVLQPTRITDYDIEKTMNRKQRVTTEEQKRNSIGTAAPGDKPFKDADREPEFYQKGGLVVGSTNTLKQSAKPTLKKREDINTKPGKKLEATYGKLVERLAREYDVSQVRTLTVIHYFLELGFDFIVS
jgi:hypothetical protein